MAHVWLIPLLCGHRENQGLPSYEARFAETQWHLWLSGGLCTGLPFQRESEGKATGTELCSLTPKLLPPQKDCPQHEHPPPRPQKTAAWFHSQLDGPSLHPDENGPIPRQPRLYSSVMTTLSHTHRSVLLRTTLLWNMCQPGRCRQNSHPPGTEKKEGQQVPLGQCWHSGTSISTARRKRCSPKLKNVTETFSHKG